MSDEFYQLIEVCIVGGVLTHIVRLVVAHLERTWERASQLKRSERANYQLVQLNEHVEQKLKEFEDVKKRVDALTVKAGFTR